MIRSVLAAGAAVLLAACAAPAMQAQWRSPQIATANVRGAPVWVECSAREETLARICEDQIAAQLGAVGVTALRPAAMAGAPRGLAAARAAGAASLLSLKLDVGVRPSSGGATLGIGLGGGSWGSHVGGGVSTGLALPLGGGNDEALSGQGALQKVAGAEMLWSGTAVAGGGTATAQIESLARTTIDALRQAGVF